jgi:RNA polymerase sigma-70 factor (ECF subfamily)
VSASTGPPHGVADLARWLAEARQGSREALGRALEGCRHYLLAVAQHALPADLQGKVGPSDLVQETLLKAQQDFHRFDGDGESQLLAWLRAILLNNAANCTRQFATDMRDVGREVALGVEDSHEVLAGCVPAPGPSPSEAFLERERDEALEQALARLPEQARQVVRLRNQENLSFEEIGRRTGQSAEAVRKAWVRALWQLKEMLKGTDE